MKKTEIQFDAEDLISAVEDVRDHLQGKRKLTMRKLVCSCPIRPRK